MSKLLLVLATILVALAVTCQAATQGNFTFDIHLKGITIYQSSSHSHSDTIFLLKQKFKSLYFVLCKKLQNVPESFWIINFFL